MLFVNWTLKYKTQIFSNEKKILLVGWENMT